MQFNITLSHDKEAGVWYVEKSDIPGLNAEAAILDDLLEIVRDLAPSLIHTNLPKSKLKDPLRIPLHFEATQYVESQDAAA
jgi:predicted RNase H-like HicB family nuclease